MSYSILHIVSDLVVGGAQITLYRLIKEMLTKDIRSSVISLGSIGLVGVLLQELGIPVKGVGIRNENIAKGLMNLIRFIKMTHPALVQTWLYHADVIGGITARLLGIPVLWTIRQATPLDTTLKRQTRFMARLGAWMSRQLPAAIAANSKSSAHAHIKFGYAREKIAVVPNGFDTHTFRPDWGLRKETRFEIGIPENAPVIGMVARYHPVKDHKSFLEAAVLLEAEMPEVHFVLMGEDVTPENPLFRHYLKRLCPGNLHLLGLRTDTHRYMMALDIMTLSSSAEAFPTVLGEAMACGIPCVTTDVGEAAMLVGGTGRTVPPQNPQALTDGWLELLHLSAEHRAELGELARKRIEENFSLSSMVGNYERLYRKILCVD